MKLPLSLKNFVTSEGAISHNVLYYQQLSDARYEVSSYTNNFLSKYQLCLVPLRSCLLFIEKTSSPKPQEHERVITKKEMNNKNN